MARYLYGGGGDGDIIQPNGTPYINTSANVYNARSGGTQITDLQNFSGATIAAVTTDTYGQAIFYGPDNYIGALWLDFGSGVRWALSPKAVDLAATRAIAVQRSADAATPTFTAKAHLPYNTADPLEQSLATALDPLVIPRFASDAARNAAFPSPAAGDRCYRTDLFRDQVYDSVSSSWVGLTPVSQWTLGTFTITPSSGTFSIGSGTMGIRFRTVGRTVHFYLWTSWASDTNYGTGTWVIEGLPFTFSTQANNVAHCSGNAFTSAGRFELFGQLGSGNKITPYAPTSTTNPQLNQIGASPTPGGGSWAAGNFIRLTGSTELA